MIKDVMERDMINEISTLFVMIFMSGLMFVMPMLDMVVCYFLLTYLSIRSIDSLAPSSSSNRLR